LALTALDAGADLRRGCAARFAAQPQGGYIVQLSIGERIRTNAAILATGRAGGSLGLPYMREYLDNNVAVAARLSSPAGHLDPRTIIEAVPGGWFYLAALPGNEVIAVLITLAKLVPSERRARLRWWLEALARTSVVRKALRGLRLPESLSVANARASFARSGTGDRWLAIGDARIAPDPLSGQGIIWAIDDAASTIELLTRMEWRDLTQNMRARTSNEVNAYCLERSRVYLSEQRFKNDAYWSAAMAKSPCALKAFPAASIRAPESCSTSSRTATISPSAQIPWKTIWSCGNSRKASD